MYQSFNTQSGAAVVAAAVAAFPISSGPDGLQVDVSGLSLPVTTTIPDRLFNWLIGLRLLKNVPLTYLVPDSSLLPAESIRFFNIDPTWVDRIVDGVFSAANTGTVDITYSAAVLASVRAALDLGLQNLAKQQVSTSTWTVANGTTGMLVRSDLVTRWPDMIVRAYAGATESTAALPVLRAEPISQNVLIAIFAGTPVLVELREPHVGVRFGLETETDVPNEYGYIPRDLTTGLDTGANPSWFTLPASRVIPLATIGSDARTVAIRLMRPPYIQQFLNTVAESRGSENPPPVIQLTRNHVANVGALNARLAALRIVGQS